MASIKEIVDAVKRRKPAENQDVSELMDYDHEDFLSAEGDDTMSGEESHLFDSDRSPLIDQIMERFRAAKFKK